MILSWMIPESYSSAARASSLGISLAVTAEAAATKAALEVMKRMVAVIDSETSRSWKAVYDEC